MQVRPTNIRLSLILAGLMALAPMALSSTLSSAARNAAASTAADRLLAADRGFAKAATAQPAAGSIGAMIDDDVVMFIVPQPPLARGKAEALQLLAKAFGPKSTISWAPVRVGISADGTQGFTYGFATRTTDGKPELAKYLSYWIHRPEGWRLAAFKLVPRPEGAVSTALRPPALPKHMVRATKDAAIIARYAADIDATERRFSDEAQVIGLAEAFRKYGSGDAMNVGGDADFAYGNDQIAAGFGTGKTSPLRWAPSGVKVASSGDLGITFGYLERNGPTPPGRLSRIPWFTVWRRESPHDPWKYVAE